MSKCNTLIVRMAIRFRSIVYTFASNYTQNKMRERESEKINEAKAKKCYKLYDILVVQTI